MRAILCLFALAFTSCTVVYEKGHKVFYTGADIDGLEFRTPAGTVLKAGRLAHSPIHRAAGDTVTKTGTAVAASGLLPFLSGLFR